MLHCNEGKHTESFLADNLIKYGRILAAAADKLFHVVAFATT